MIPGHASCSRRGDHFCCRTFHLALPPCPISAGALFSPGRDRHVFYQVLLPLIRETGFLHRAVCIEPAQHVQALDSLKVEAAGLAAGIVRAAAARDAMVGPVSKLFKSKGWREYLSPFLRSALCWVSAPAHLFSDRTAWRHGYGA